MPQQDWLEKDFYKILGVSKDVEDAELTKAYRKLARKYHPDANPGDQRAENRFKEVSEAYEVLGNVERRKEYDEIRRYGGGFGGFGRGNSGDAGQTSSDFSSSDFSEVLNDLLRSQQKAGAAAPRKGTDLEASLSLQFDDAVNGVTTSVRLTSDAACSTCRATGARPGTAPQDCTACRGRGVSDLNQGLFSFSQPCTVCAGRGKVVLDPCPSCQATGLERRSRQVKVRIPPGVREGQRIRLKGKGTPGRNGGPAGDLLVKISVAADSMFGRSGNNLTVEVPISFTDAALGALVKVPTLDGGTVTLKIPAGTKVRKTFRVKGKGVTTTAKTGDLLVTAVVQVPSELNAKQRSALEAFARASVEP